MSNYSIPLEEYFRYHPPMTEERKARHDAINQAAIAFAKAVQENVQDEDLYKMTIYAIQMARMLANQGITIDELKQQFDSVNSVD